MPKSTDVDVVIVGAGSAGLSAAKVAAEIGLDFKVLEASHRIGGRAYTETFLPGQPFDLGCHWMHSASINPFVAIADKYGASYRRDGAWRRKIFADGRWLTNEESDAKLAGMDAAYEAICRAGEDGRDIAVAELIDYEASYAPFLAYWDSLATSRDTDQVSVMDVVNYNETDENWPLISGYGALVATWAADVPVTLNAAVDKITWSADSVRVESSQGTVTGRTALITVSTNILASGRIQFDPVLPLWKQEAVAALPLGVHNRIAIECEQDFLDPDASRHGNVHLGGDDVPMAFQVNPYGYDLVVGVTGGRHAEWLENAGQAASVDHLTERLVAVYGSQVRTALGRRQIVTAWGADPWTLGSYSAATPGNGHRRADMAAPVDDLLFFAGEATSPDAFATCHGAYQSGIDAMRRISETLTA